MLDIRRIRQNPQELLDALQKRNSKIDLTEFLQKEEERRTVVRFVTCFQTSEEEVRGFLQELARLL